MSRLFEALSDAANGAFVTDEKLHIVYWNEAAEAILGFDNGDVADQYCFQILHGYDDERRLICKARCQVAELVLNSKPVSDYDIRVQTKQGNNHWLNMSVFTYRMRENDDKKVIVHLFSDINQKKDEERFFHRLLEVARRFYPFPSGGRASSETSPDVLSPREREVLTLLVKGQGTDEISQQLSISPNTVRNHVQQILHKLHVHNRLEAVVYAIKHNLVD